MISRPGRWSVIGVAAAAGLALAATAHAQDEEPIAVGVLAPLTGGAAADGQEMVRGVELAVKDLNAAGGVAGHRVEVITADVQEQSADAVANAVERLVNNRSVQAVFTGYASTSNFEIETMAEYEMVYLLSANSAQTRDIISPDPDFFTTVWSLTPSFDAYETQVRPVIEQLQADGKVPTDKTVAIISSDNPYSRTIYEGLKESFTEGGWTITSDELVPFGEINDWRAFLAQVRDDQPAVVINTDYLPGNAATFMTQFMEQPTDSMVFIQYAPSVPEFIDLTKDVSTGVTYNLLGGILRSPENPRAQELLQKFEDEYGVPSGPYGVMLYEQVMIWADAVEEVGDPFDRYAVGEAIGETSKRTAQGVVEFDPATHLAKQGDDFIPIQFYQIWDGERVLFYPPRYAQGEFRAPPWIGEGE